LKALTLLLRSFSYSQLYSDDVDCERTRASFHVQLQRSKEGLNIPQVVAIDQAGMIRATSSGHCGCPALEIRTSLLTLTNCLLNEGLSTGVKKRNSFQRHR